MRFYPTDNPPPNICILRIDNDPDEHIVLSVILAELGLEYDKICVDTGEDALEYLGKAAMLPDYIIVDYNLPGMSGVEFIRTVKTAERYKAIPVTLYSPHLSCTEHQEAKAAGMDCFIERIPDAKFIKEQLLRYAPFLPLQ